MKGQASLEYMMIAGFALLVFLPGLYIFSTYMTTSTSSINTARVIDMGSELVGEIEQMNYLPAGSRSTVFVRVPEYVTGMEVTSSDAGNLYGTELVITIDIQGEDSNMVFFTQADVSVGGCGVNTPFVPADLTEGQKQFMITSCGDTVSIT